MFPGIKKGQKEITEVALRFPLSPFFDILFIWPPVTDHWPLFYTKLLSNIKILQL